MVITPSFQVGDDSSILSIRSGLVKTPSNLRVGKNSQVAELVDANKVRSQLECRNTFMYPKMISYRFKSCPDYLNTGEYINWLDYVLWEHEVVGSSPASPTEKFFSINLGP